MGSKCIVRGCESEWYPACNVIFHRFPSDVKERSKWLAIVPLRRPYSKTVKICSLHFKDTDYNKSGKKLLNGAIPFFQKSNKPVQSETEEPTLSYESMDEPSTSPHELSPLRDETLSHENIPVQECNPPYKKSLLFEALMRHRGDENKVQVNNQSTAPIKISESKSIQARIKTPREIALEKKNKILAQKVSRLTKYLNRNKFLLKIARSNASKSEIKNIRNGNSANVCEILETSQQSPESMSYSEEHDPLNAEESCNGHELITNSNQSKILPTRLCKDVSGNRVEKTMIITRVSDEISLIQVEEVPPAIESDDLSANTSKNPVIPTDKGVQRTQKLEKIVQKQRKAMKLLGQKCRSLAEKVHNLQNTIEKKENQDAVMARISLTDTNEVL